MRLMFVTIIFLTITLTSHSEGLQLLKGDNRDSQSLNFSDMQKADKILRAGAYGMQGFSNFESGNVYYVLMGEFIGKFDMPTEEFIGTWPLNPFADENLEPEIVKLYQEYDITPDARTADNLLPVLGCFFQAPLRYGDVSGDGNTELVVFTQDEFHALNFTLFSTQKQKVIFNVRLATYDATPNTRITLPEGVQPSASFPLANHPTDGQFLSRIAEQRTRMVTGTSPAVINFSKLFFGSFSSEADKELLVWRKLYRSRLNQDPVQGFELQRNTFIHYKLIDGEYQQQDTPEATMRGWLAAKELTWQKGFPSKSECLGQEGQLIPEMHDVLLNDPDVLM